MSEPGWVFIVFMIVASVMCIGVFATDFLFKKQAFRYATRAIELAAQVANKESGTKEIPTDVMDSIVTGYHEQAMLQSKIQFYISLTVAVIGFGWILFSPFYISADNLNSIWKITPGVLVDLLAFCFVYQSQQTRKSAADYFDRLRHDKRIIDSQKLAEKIEDVKFRSAVQAQIALQMAGTPPGSIDFTPLLKATRNTNKKPELSPE